MALDTPTRSTRILRDSALVHRLRFARSRAVPLDAVGAVSRGLVSAAVCWQLLWFLTQPSLLPQAQSTWLSSVAVTTVLVLAVVLLLVHLLGPRTSSAGVARVNVAVLLGSTVVVSVSQARSPEPDWHRVAELAALAAGVAGVLLSTRWGLASAVALTALLLGAVLIPDASGLAHSAVDAVLDPLYVLAMGLSSVAARRLLLARAAAADDSATDLLRVEQEIRTAEVVAQRLRETERRLHESVLNTLVALARGGLSTEWRARITNRCEEGARLLESLGRRGADLPEVTRRGESLQLALSDAIADVEASGAVVRWSEQHVDLPDAVLGALRTACAEALTNVGRHAGASHVEVEVSALGGSGRRGVGVSIRDDGRGFDPAAVVGRFGITDAIARPLVDVGGTADVESSLGQGTSVLLRWWAPASEGEPDHAALDPSPAVLAIPVLLVLAVYASVTLVVTRESVASPLLNASAFAMWLALTLVVVWQSRRGALPWPTIVAVALGGWATYAMQEAASPGAITAGWSSPAIAGLFLVVAAAGPSWGWLVLLVTWLVLQGDPIGELTQPGTAIILVGALLGRSLRRNARLAWERRSEVERVASAGRDTRASIERIAMRYLPLRHSSAARLLRDVADGCIDPSEPQVRTVAAREERFIRNVMRTDPSEGPVQSLAAALVIEAHARHVLLDLDLMPGSPGVEHLDARVVDAFTAALRHASPTVMVDGRAEGSTARLTFRREGDAAMLRLLVPMSQPPRPPREQGGLHPQLVDEDDPGGQLWLWETAVQAGGLADDATGDHR